MQVVRLDHAVPSELRHSIYLGGAPLIGEATWRRLAVARLDDMGYGGVVLYPSPALAPCLDRPTTPVPVIDRDTIQEATAVADAVVCWVPATHMGTGFEVGTALGAAAARGTAFFGTDATGPDATRLLAAADDLKVACFTSLDELLEEAMLNQAFSGVSDPFFTRRGAERFIPRHLWRSRSFRHWLSSQRRAGNELLEARVEWASPRSTGKVPFVCAIEATLDVPQERRIKTELVVFRSDVAAVVALTPPGLHTPPEVVCVKELRCAAATADGFVHELPGGSSMSTTDPRTVAADEFGEETGLEIDPARLVDRGARQLAPTLCAHRMHIFSLELTFEEAATLREQARTGAAHGVEGTTERAYTEVVGLEDLAHDLRVDWGTLGAALAAARPE